MPSSNGSGSGSGEDRRLSKIPQAVVPTRPSPLPPMPFAIGAENDAMVSFQAALTALGADMHSPHMVDTPRRIVEYLSPFFANVNRRNEALAELRKASYDKQYDGTVTALGIQTFGLCPHHLLPIDYETAVAYLPREKVVGLSKLPRAVQWASGRPVTQEDFTHDLANLLCEGLGVHDVAVYAVGSHDCMRIRGVRQRAAAVVTTTLFGKFHSNEDYLRSEFLKQVRL